MKKAINIWSFGEKKLGDSLKLAKEVGFEGIELALDETGEVSLESTEEELLALKKTADDLRLNIHSLATGLYWQYSLTSDDEKTREKAYNIVEKQIETAKILGADGILVIPGAVGVDFIPGAEVVQYDAVYDRALSALLKLKEKAEDACVKICIENVWNKFLLSPLEMRDFVDKIGSEYVGVYFDVGNVIYNGYPEQWIRILGSRIKKVHFKDYRRETAGLVGFVDLLSGDVNWPEVMKAFDEIGYDGWGSAEMIPSYNFHNDQIIYNTFGAMTKIIGGAE